MGIDPVTCALVFMLPVLFFTRLALRWLSPKIGCASTMLKKKPIFLGIVFGLHFVGFAEDRLRLGIKNKKLRFSFCSSLGLHYLCRLNQTILKMTAGNLIRFVCILLLWLFLCYILITRAARIDFMVIFTIVASGIIVFVPLYKKYVRKKN